VAAQRDDPAARTPDVAEQQLQDRRGADRLHAGRVLRPGDGVRERGRALAAAVAQQQPGDAQERPLRHAGGALDELRRVAGEVALEDLEDAARVLQGLVELWRLAVLERGGS
jgi:hypothetical protein